MKPALVAAAALLLGGFASATLQAAEAGQPAPPQGGLARTSEQIWEFTDWRVVTMRDGQVQLWDLRDPARPILRDVRHVRGAVHEVAVANGELRLTVLATQEQRWRIEPNGQLAALPGEATPQACPGLVARDQPRTPSRYVGAVAGVEAGEVVVVVAEDAEVWLDQAIALVAPADLASYGGLARQVLAVSRIEGRKAYAELPRGETATAGELVVATGEAPSKYRVAPAKLAYGNWWSAGIAAVLPTTTHVGGGLSVTAGANLGGPWEVELRANPLYAAVDGSLGPALLSANLRHDADYWALGVGLGGLNGSDRDCLFGDGFWGGLPAPAAADRCWGWRPALSVEARLGSKDGLHAALAAAIAGDYAFWGPAMLEGEAWLPLSRAADAGLHWIVGHDVTSVEIAARYGLIGNRGPGSTVLQIGLGGVEAEWPGWTSLAGPQLTVAISHRY